MKKTTYAENLNYWKTSNASADAWMEKTRTLLKRHKGELKSEAYGRDSNGNAAFLVEFEIDGDAFKVVWPVLPSLTRNVLTAKIQAATMIHHDIKSRLIAAAVLGARSAFFAYLQLPSGQTVYEASLTTPLSGVPKLLLPPTTPVGVVEGEWE